MSKGLAPYRELELRLWMARWKNDREESIEEDQILDEMEDVWINLAEDERAVLRLEGPKCWPTEFDSWPPDLSCAMEVAAQTAWTYDGFHSPAEAIQSAEAA